MKVISTGRVFRRGLRMAGFRLPKSNWTVFGCDKNIPHLNYRLDYDLCLSKKGEARLSLNTVSHPKLSRGNRVES
jgi:hypothetical protein